MEAIKAPEIVTDAADIVIIQELGSAGLNKDKRLPHSFAWEIHDLLAPGSEEDRDWQARSICNQVDPELFFPEQGGSNKEAKKICAGCEVKDECLKFALSTDQRFGVWGGLSERERRKLRKNAA